MIPTLELVPGSATVARLPFDLPVYLTLRTAGDMGPSGAAVQERRDAALSDIGIDPSRYVTVNQVHSQTVLAVGGEARAPEQAEADGMLTDDPRLALGVTVADCVPIFLAAPRRGVFGALHSGWKGTGIVSEALRLARDHYGAAPHEFSVLLGPSIGPCCYRVDEERAALFLDLWGSPAVVRRSDGPYLDLRRANVDLLAARGVERVTVVDQCTSCNTDLGSFRRDGAEGFTRMMAVITGE
jgi:hypothetical protein